MDLEIKTEYLAYNQDFPQHLCLMCGKCCKAITTPYTHEELIQLASEGQEEAKVFVEIFKRYPSIEDAKRAVPDHVENILNNLRAANPNFDEANVSFYYCPHLTDDNKCSIHSIRPDCCRRAPRNGWSLFPPDCGFKGWQFQEKERVKANIRKIKEYIIELEQLEPTTFLANRNMTVSDFIKVLEEKMQPWEKYGSKHW